MGGAYLTSDINKYFNGISETNYQTKPASTNDIDLTVGTTTYSNNTSLVGTITSANIGNASFAGILELTQDISTSATIAQGATVNVYFTEGSEQGLLVLLNRILQPGAEQQPTVVTSSWLLWLGDDSSYIGKLSDSGSVVSLVTALFQQIAALGINVFIAQGDWGADDWWTLGTSSPTVPDGKSHVSYAATDPWVTSCGGTIVARDSSAPTGFQEEAWSDAWSTTSSFTFGANSGATGGGVSQDFSAPPYQTAAGVTGAVDSAGNSHAGRGVPDVAAMVAYSGSGSNDWFFANGVTYNFMGTSCVAPLMAGLAAVLRSAFGRALGPYNTLLYELSNSAFNDVTTGNNDSVDTPANVKSVISSYSGHTPDAPYFTAAAGWDACTGLGSIDGTKLLNGIASLLYTPNFYFQVNKGSFGLDEVNVNASYSQPPPLWLVLEGYTPDAVTAAHLTPTVQASVTGLTITVGAPVLEIASETSTPQRVLFPCSVDFAASAIKTIAQGGIFPAPGTPPTPTTVELITSVTIGGRILSAETSLELEPGADPFFANFDAAGANPFWLSQDLRVFTVTPGSNNAPIGGVALNAADNTHWDTGAAYQYIQALLAYLNSTYQDSSAGDAFAAFPNQTNALSGDSSVTPTSIDPAHPTGTRFANYNFAVARVRLSGAANSSSGANVRVLFRLFAAETGDTDYQTLTYPSTSDSEGQPLAPQLGTGNVTIPFFATGNYQANSDYAANVDYSANSINNQPVPIGGKRRGVRVLRLLPQHLPASATRSTGRRCRRSSRARTVVWWPNSSTTMHLSRPVPACSGAGVLEQLRAAQSADHVLGQPGSGRRSPRTSDVRRAAESGAGVGAARAVSGRADDRLGTDAGGRRCEHLLAAGSRRRCARAGQLALFDPPAERGWFEHDPVRGARRLHVRPDPSRHRRELRGAVHRRSPSGDHRRPGIHDHGASGVDPTGRGAATTPGARGRGGRRPGRSGRTTPAGHAELALHRRHLRRAHPRRDRRHDSAARGGHPGDHEMAARPNGVTEPLDPSAQALHRSDRTARQRPRRPGPDDRAVSLGGPRPAAVRGPRPTRARGDRQGERHRLRPVRRLRRVPSADRSGA